MFKTLPLAGLLVAALCAAAPARAGSFLDSVFGHAQVDRRAALAQAAAPARPHGNHAERPRHAAGSVLASWYGGAKGERLARRTASGERFNPSALTAAHRTLPLGSRARVCRAIRCVIVRINDRGPAQHTGRGIDLSRAAASAIGLTRVGVGRVSIKRI